MSYSIKFLLNLLLVSLTLLALSAPPGATADSIDPTDPSPCELVILSDPEDPYYALAREIAAAEKAPLNQDLNDALACHPTFLLWVISPASLSEAVMVEFGLAMEAQASVISSGIITGSTLEGARDLWERRTQVQNEELVAANAPNPSAHIDPGRIIQFSPGKTETRPLTLTGFEDALRSADYLTFTGHGGNRFLGIGPDTAINTGDIPELESLVISTGSCQTFQPWNQDSIALQFVDQGAAAYSGFVFSPNEGYLIGEFHGLPYRYTWPDFPIGHVIQVQNRGTLQGFAHFSYQFLLGDPRIAFQTRTPYQLVEDRLQGNQRILHFREVPSGVIPIRIKGGAAYNFVEFRGVTAAAQGDPFFNDRLQMVNIHDDKLILLEHTGGDLTLVLHLQPPWYWFFGDVLLDSLDYTLLFSQGSSGDILALGFAILPLAWAGWQVYKKRLGWREFRLAMVIGTGAALLYAAYALFRLEHLTIIAKAVLFSPLSLLGVFTLTTCGSLVYFQTRSWLGKISGLLIATFISWAPLVFGLLTVATINIFFSRPQIGVDLYNYSLGLIPAGSFAFTLVLFGLAFWYANRWIKPG